MAGYSNDAAYDTCDTDAISITSTVQSDPQDEYTVECILCDEYECDEKTMRYLVKWQDYGWHRHRFAPASCTWEPVENLSGTGLLDEWAEEKRIKGETAFEEIKQSNKVRFELAVKESAAAKEQRQEKRHKKRRKQTMQRRCIVPSDDSGDDLPLTQQNRATQVKAGSREASKQKDKSAAGSFDSLFVGSQESLSPPLRSVLHTRKLPLYQSSSEDGFSPSDADDSEDSLLANREEKDLELTAERTTHKEREQNLQKGERKTNQQGKGPVETATMATIKASHADIAKKKSLPQVTKPATQIRLPTQRKACGPLNNAIPKPHTIGASAAVGNSTTTAAPRLSNTAYVPMNKSSVAGPKSAGAGIKMLNRPKAQLRKERHSSDKQYTKLRFRGFADKKSRAEAAPDFNALQIVHGPSVATTRPKISVPDKNSCTHRENANRRVPEANSGDNLPRGSTDVSVPLEKWEEAKIPLVCPQWRLSNNCAHGSAKCRFLHRHKDALGRDLKVAPADGSMPAKYRNPPLTCPFWLEPEGGCKKSADECSFAHENTGWRPHRENRSESERIDPNQAPASMHTTHGNLPFDKGNMKLTSSQITCWFWKHGYCRYKPKDCAYQHVDTGILANPPPNTTPCRNCENGTCPYTAKMCRLDYGQTDASLGLPSNRPNPANSMIIQRRGIIDLEQTPSTNFSPTIDSEMADSAARVATDNVNPTNVQNKLPMRQTASLSTTENSVQKSMSQPSQYSRLTEQPLVGMSCLQLKQKIEQACKLDFAKMFNSNRKRSSMVERRAFLLYHPEDHAQELDLVTRWLLMYHVEVGSAWYDGSWDHFKQQIMRGGTGVIIAHPDFEYFYDLPDFGQVLKSDVRLWSVGLQAAIEYDPAVSGLPPELQYDRIEIFPLGGFIYVTDEVFEKKPQLALKIVELFFAKIRKLRHVAGQVSPWHEVADAAVFWRLCVRPELMQHLWETCERHDAELQARNPDHLSRAKLYELLNTTNWIEQDEPVVPLSMVQDKHPILSERYEVAKEEPVNYFNTLAHSQEMANLHMIQYYVGLLIDMRRDYRHFYVVHTEPSAPYVRAWKTIQNIADVMTPEQLIEELEKPSKESKIDFYE